MDPRNNCEDETSKGQRPFQNIAAVIPDLIRDPSAERERSQTNRTIPARQSACDGFRLEFIPDNDPGPE